MSYRFAIDTGLLGCIPLYVKVDNVTPSVDDVRQDWALGDTGRTSRIHVLKRANALKTNLFDLIRYIPTLHWDHFSEWSETTNQTALTIFLTNTLWIDEICAQDERGNFIRKHFNIDANSILR